MGHLLAVAVRADGADSGASLPFVVMPGLAPSIHVSGRGVVQAWMAGSSPVMTDVERLTTPVDAQTLEIPLQVPADPLEHIHARRRHLEPLPGDRLEDFDIDAR